MIVRLLLGAALVTAAGAGYLATVALSSSSAPQRTVTVTLRNGATGPQGPPGSSTCPAGFEHGVLVINAPSGHVTIATCLQK